MTRFDIAVIGGGINGAAVARDAAGRGLSVYLAEAEDYASATSSGSSKLIHGGIRYLEQFEFRLVRESLHEREVMLRLAPHLVYPLQFLIPVRKGQVRPAWVVQIGLILYDLLSGRRQLARTGRLGAAERRAVPRLRQDGLRAVLHYPDCWADDARLTLETLLDARARGADIGNRRRVTGLAPEPDGFRLEVATPAGTQHVHATHVVNAAGPWANDLLAAAAGTVPRRKRLRLVRGSHIVLPMPQPAEARAFLMQNDDRRVVFVLPWLDARFIILGTTDVPHDGDAHDAHCTDAERDYLLACYRRYFDVAVGPQDVLWSYSAVRPLVDDGSDNPSKVTRDYEIVGEQVGRGTFTTIYGGKLTTHRKLAESVMAELRRMGVAMRDGWTADQPLHGGSLDRPALSELAAGGPATLALAVRQRWAFTYGDQTRDLFDRIAAQPALAREVAPGVPEAELRHAIEVEDAMSADDFLLRRTKLALILDAAGRGAITDWFATHGAAPFASTPQAL
ncbi:glycerol-3-phosphate dehydrogenase [Zavarzinia sp. CC-PAN008]|uniref:glycerol-3-phosphate dehydrogenase n=1 Tax=Zavarzinia sp. CC-PAN008 TaxID=3243332 RepID=UPI003F74A9E3